ncbi:MAG TPA: prolipoprotein diacylglyceryl transferase, partial [Ruminococcus sp.]|nr:prolipoprotein diacylglyceryl transferase [Ruminococcus sp.]
GAERFVVEGLRTDSLMIGNMRVSQALSLIICIISIILQIIFHFRVKRDPERYILYADTEESKLLLSESGVKSKNKSKEIKNNSESDIKEENQNGTDN